MKKIFTFQGQLKVGNQGESDFVKYYPDLNPVKSKDNKIDFILNDNKTLELKSDSYEMSKTPNFFMEIFGDNVKGSVGGPMRSFKDKIDFFVYYFINDKTFFWFEPLTLCKEINEIILNNNIKTTQVWNKGYTTEGYLIKRDLLDKVLIKKDVFN